MKPTNMNIVRNQAAHPWFIVGRAAEVQAVGALLGQRLLQAAAYGGVSCKVRGQVGAEATADFEAERSCAVSRVC